MQNSKFWKQSIPFQFWKEHVFVKTLMLFSTSISHQSLFWSLTEGVENSSGSIFLWRHVTPHFYLDDGTSAYDNSLVRKLRYYWPNYHYTSIFPLWQFVMCHKLCYWCLTKLTTIYNVSYKHYCHSENYLYSAWFTNI